MTKVQNVVKSIVVYFACMLELHRKSLIFAHLVFVQGKLHYYTFIKNE